MIENCPKCGAEKLHYSQELVEYECGSVFTVDGELVNKQWPDCRIAELERKLSEANDYANQLMRGLLAESHDRVDELELQLEELLSGGGVSIRVAELESQLAEKIQEADMHAANYFGLLRHLASDDPAQVIVRNRELEAQLAKQTPLVDSYKMLLEVMGEMATGDEDATQSDAFITVWSRQQVKLAEATAENERLKRGDFTPDELQNLCHNLSEDDYKAFCEGCDEYQLSLFGKCRTHDLKVMRIEDTHALKQQVAEVTAERDGWSRQAAEILAEKVAVTAELDEYKADALRYRWLRDEMGAWEITLGDGYSIAVEDGEDLDAVVEAARKESETEGA